MAELMFLFSISHLKCFQAKFRYARKYRRCIFEVCLLEVTGTAEWKVRRKDKNIEDTKQAFRILLSVIMQN